MEVLLFCVLLCIGEGAVIQNHPQFKDSYLEQTMVEDVISDLVGRRRLIVRDLETDELFVFWVKQDAETQLPYVQDPKTNLPYLLQDKAQSEDTQLFRMIRGRNHRFVVTSLYNNVLYRPVINTLGEVDLIEISETEAGFTRKDVSQM